MTETVTREPLYLQGAKIDYTNYRGERGARRIVPLEMLFGSTEHHATPQWLMRAYDLDKKAERVFALKAIHSWAPIGP